MSLWINCVVYLSWAGCQLFVDISEDKTKFTYNTKINLLCVDIFFLFTGLHVICTKTPIFFYIIYIPHVLHTWISMIEGFLILSYKSPSHYITELLFSLIIIYISIYMYFEICCEWISIGRGYNVWDIFRYHVISGIELNVHDLIFCD